MNKKLNSHRRNTKQIIIQANTLIESASFFLNDNPHLIVLNAFTKIYAMAGLRLGCLFTSNTGLLQKIKSLKSEWNVSSPAQIAGKAALKEDAYLNESLCLIRQERDFLEGELKALGFTPLKSEVNFILISNMSEECYDFMLKNNILIRKCDNFPGLGKTDYRIAVKKHDENLRLIQLLKKLSAGDKK